MAIDNPFIGLKYLAVDDFPAMRSMVKSILQGLGVPAKDISVATTGEEAIALLAKRRFDVVLCDYNLGPGKDGQQVLEEARHRGLLGLHSIFIMITAENTREMVMSAVEHEPDNYLSKPFNKELLRTRLTRLFERKHVLQPVNDALTSNNYPKALALLNAMIAKNPKNLPDLQKIKAQISIQAGRYDDALDIYDQALQARDMAWARLGKAKVLFSKKQYAEAKTLFQGMIEEYPYLVAAFDWLAKIQTIEGDLATAEATLSRAVKLSPKAVRRQHQLGDLALQNGNSELAEKAYNRAVSFGQHSVFSHPSALSGLAKSKSANNKHLDALKVVQDLAKSFPDDPEAEFYQATTKAVIKQNQGDTKGAAEELQKAEGVLSQFEHGATGKLGLEMASACSQLGQNDRANSLLRTVVANNHDDDSLLGAVGQVLKASGLSDAPEQMIEDIRKDVFRKNNKGVKLIREGRLDEAIHLLHDAADELPSNKTINLNAAKACLMKMEAQGNNKEDLNAANRFIERVRRMAPDDWRLSSLIPRLQQLAHNQ
ncbi:MAG: tetratricopeptide repeat protein [Gammaproteobacteria bacterium SHHR-1]|uniref:tetratricopeptide repeat-containing response regulator n=1 Tax=Magnetovirga frankeli TaxID=947516 RepID=UPI0012931D26|nr:tetratricopeptide repeat protein [gamma proteobacterium SS-5]